MKTERCSVTVSTLAQMETLIQNEADENLRAAYAEMLAGCLSHPAQWAWYAVWWITRHDGTPIGKLCFKGVDEGGFTEIGYGIDEAYQGFGYATEAVHSVTDWAFTQPGICGIVAETEADNLASIRVLEKCGFRSTGLLGEEGPRFVREAP